MTRKIHTLSVDEEKAIFDGQYGLVPITQRFSASEVMQRIKEWEEKRKQNEKSYVTCKYRYEAGGDRPACEIYDEDPIGCIKFSKWQSTQIDGEIEVGDEVYLLDENNVRIVTGFYTSHDNQIQASQTCKNGKWCADNVVYLHKTGGHFSQIAEILKQLKGDK